jgi:hypothetical protein
MRGTQNWRIFLQLKVEWGREKLEQTTPKICKLPSFLQAKKYVDTIELNI